MNVLGGRGIRNGRDTIFQVDSSNVVIVTPCVQIKAKGSVFEETGLTYAQIRVKKRPRSEGKDFCLVCKASPQRRTFN